MWCRPAYAPQTKLRVGLCLALAKKHDEAIAFLSQSMKDLKDPAQSAEANLLIGRSYLDAGKTSQAVAALDQARQAKADWERGDEVLLELARALRADKKLAESVSRLDELGSLAEHTFEITERVPVFGRARLDPLGQTAQALGLLGLSPDPSREGRCLLGESRSKISWFLKPDTHRRAR